MRSIKTDLRNIPGVGKSIEQDLIDIGINCVNDLKGRDSSGGIGKTKNIRRRNKVMYSADIFDNSI